MEKDSPPDLQAKIRNKRKEARTWVTAGFRQYFRQSVNLLNRKEPLNYIIGHYSYAWLYQSQGLRVMRDALKLNPAWVQAHPRKMIGENTDILRMVNAKLQGESITNANIPPTPLRGSVDPMMVACGVINNKMQFPQLNTGQLALLDQIQSSHARWVNAVLDGKMDHTQVLQLAYEQHDLHHALEMTAHTPNEQILLTITDHTPHEICRNRPKSEIDRLIRESDNIHRAWITAVRSRNFAEAWRTALLHSRMHVLLATCGDDVDGDGTVDEAMGGL